MHFLEISQNKCFEAFLGHTQTEQRLKCQIYQFQLRSRSPRTGP